MYLIHTFYILFIKTPKKFLSFMFPIIYNAFKKITELFKKS